MLRQTDDPKPIRDQHVACGEGELIILALTPPARASGLRPSQPNSAKAALVPSILCPPTRRYPEPRIERSSDRLQLRSRFRFFGTEASFEQLATVTYWQDKQGVTEISDQIDSIQAVEQVAAQRGYALVMATSNFDGSVERQNVERLASRQVRGLVASALNAGTWTSGTGAEFQPPCSTQTGRPCTTPAAFPTPSAGSPPATRAAIISWWTTSPAPSRRAPGLSRRCPFRRRAPSNHP